MVNRIKCLLEVINIMSVIKSLYSVALSPCVYFSYNAFHSIFSVKGVGGTKLLDFWWGRQIKGDNFQKGEVNLVGGISKRYGDKDTTALPLKTIKTL